MPFYSYRCSKCESLFEKFHSMSETPTICAICFEEGCLTRVPSTVNVIQHSDSGQIVKEFIEKTKEETKQEKERLLKQKYNK